MLFCNHVMHFVEGIGCQQVYQRIGDPADTMAVYMVATKAMIADAATQALQKKHGVESATSSATRKPSSHSTHGAVASTSDLRDSWPWLESVTFL